MYLSTFINFERAPRRERLTHELQAVFAPILGVHSEILRSTTERDRRLRSLSVNDGILRDSLRDAVRRLSELFVQDVPLWIVRRNTRALRDAILQFLIVDVEFDPVAIMGRNQWHRISRTHSELLDVLHRLLPCLPLERAIIRRRRQFSHVVQFEFEPKSDRVEHSFFVDFEFERLLRRL